MIFLDNNFILRTIVFLKLLKLLKGFKLIKGKIKIAKKY
jgi:hypothetical protein